MHPTHSRTHSLTHSHTHTHTHTHTLVQASYGYLEACMRALVDGSTDPIFLSSGAEDYFLSAYYFNEVTGWVCGSVRDWVGE